MEKSRGDSASSTEAEAGKKSRRREFKAALKAKRAERKAGEEAARLEKEAGDRVGIDEARARAEARAGGDASDAGDAPAAVHTVSDARGKNFAKVEVTNADGETIRIQETVPGAENVELVYGERIGTDPATGQVTVPRKISPGQMPTLVREIVRAANMESEPDIKKERQKFKDLQAGFNEICRDFRERDFADLREKYEDLERAHSKTVIAANKKLTALMLAAEARYKAATGHDLYKSAGGRDAFTYDLGREVARGQDNLVHQYAENGSRYYYGDYEGIQWSKVLMRLLGRAPESGTMYGEGIEKKEHRPILAGLRQILSNSDTVKDYRFRRKIHGGTVDARDSRGLSGAVSSFLSFGPDVARSYGKSAATIALGLGIIALELPRKMLNKTLDFVGNKAESLQDWLGKHMMAPFKEVFGYSYDDFKKTKNNILNFFWPFGEDEGKAKGDKRDKK